MKEQLSKVSYDTFLWVQDYMVKKNSIHFFEKRNFNSLFYILFLIKLIRWEYAIRCPTPNVWILMSKEYLIKLLAFIMLFLKV